MPETMTADVEVVREALGQGRERVNVTLDLPRSSAEKLLELLIAEQASGAVVVPVKELLTTTEAATMLGVSRPTLMKSIDAGQIDCVMVGTHHRIPARALLEFQRARRARRDDAAAALAEFSNTIGMVD